MGLVLHILVLVAIYSILAIALNIQVGMAGLFNLGLAAFFGIGAYTSAILSLTYNVPVWLSLIAGMLMAAIVGFVIGLPALRLVGDYLAVVTMGLGEIARAVFKNWVPVTNGPMGLRGIPHFSLFGLSINTTAGYLVFGAIVLVLVYVVTERIRLSPFGRVLRGVREDEVGAQALGRNTYWFKMLAFVVGCALSGVAGGLYAHYLSFIDPSTFVMSVTFLMFLAIMMGGLSNNLGVVVATAVLYFLREGLRFVGLPPSVASPLQQLLFGVLLVVMTIFVPKGIIPERKPRYAAPEPARTASEASGPSA